MLVPVCSLYPVRKTKIHGRFNLTLRDPQFVDGDTINVDVNGVRVIGRYTTGGRDVPFPITLNSGSNTLAMIVQRGSCHSSNRYGGSDHRQCHQSSGRAVNQRADNRPNRDNYSCQLPKPSSR